MTTKNLMAIILVGLACLTLIAAIWHPKPADSSKQEIIWVSDNNPARTDQIDQFNRDHPEYLLTLDYGNAGLQKLVLQSSSGVGPDVMDYSDDQLQALVAAGVLKDVTEEAQKRGFDATKDSWPTATASMTLDGKQYGYPCNTGAPILLYNKNVFDKFGVPYPQEGMTLDQLVELAQKVDSYALGQTKWGTQGTHGLVGLQWQILFELQRGEYFDDQGRLTIANNPELKRALQTHKDLIFKDGVMPTTVEAKAMSGQGGWGAGNLNQFGAGKFAMMVTGEWALNGLGRTYQQQVANLQAAGIKPEDIKNPLDRPIRLGAVLIPRYPDLKASYRVTCRLAGINAHSPNQERALAFLAYLAGPSYSKLINETADYLPGNPKYADLGVEAGPPALARIEMQEKTKEAVNYGYNQRRSPFLLSTDVTRVMTDQVSRLESDPSLNVEELLQTAQSQLDVLMRRNLDRDPRLKELYEKRFGSK